MPSLVPLSTSSSLLWQHPLFWDVPHGATPHPCPPSWSGSLHDNSPVLPRDRSRPGAIRVLGPRLISLVPPREPGHRGLRLPAGLNFSLREGSCFHFSQSGIPPSQGGHRVQLPRYREYIWVSGRASRPCRVREVYIKAPGPAPFLLALDWLCPQSPGDN